MMKEKLRKTSDVKISIVDKISKFVIEYARYKKISKYFKHAKFNDTLGIEYFATLIDKEKLFEHTAYFKKYKHEKTFVISGAKTMNFLFAANEYMEKRYKTYTILEKKIKKLFEKENEFTKEDLREINKLYKEFKNECEKKAK